MIGLDGQLSSANANAVVPCVTYTKLPAIIGLLAGNASESDDVKLMNPVCAPYEIVVSAPPDVTSPSSTATVLPDTAGAL